MIKKTIAALLLTLSTLTFANASTLKEAGDATFKLYEADRGICSMTFVGNDADGAIFLTANHCVDGEGLNYRTEKKNDKYEIISEEIHYLKKLRTSAEDDTALLQVLDKDVTIKTHAADIATPEEAKKLSFGDDLVVLGFPAAAEKSMTTGKFTAKIKGVLDVKEQYQTTVPVAGGNSGGGLYAKFGNEYKLIGTTSAKRRDNEIMTYFSTAEAVKRALAGFLDFKSSSPIDMNKLPGGRVDEK